MKVYLKVFDEGFYDYDDKFLLLLEKFNNFYNFIKENVFLNFQITFFDFRKFFYHAYQRNYFAKHNDIYNDSITDHLENMDILNFFNFKILNFFYDINILFGLKENNDVELLLNLLR